jgi:hypothetical protein
MAGALGGLVVAMLILGVTAMSGQRQAVRWWME